jgi:very-short-patch-repair endonuclease
VTIEKVPYFRASGDTIMSREFARRLRKNPTDAERRLWSHLKLRQHDGKRFRRQATIGRFIVDFVCFETKLIIELDGGQHATQVDYDENRTAWLNAQGFRVLRFWNFQVLEETEVVLEAIWNALQVNERQLSLKDKTRTVSNDTGDATPPHPNPPPQVGREPDASELLGSW